VTVRLIANGREGVGPVTDNVQNAVQDEVCVLMRGLSSGPTVVRTSTMAVLDYNRCKKKDFNRATKS